MKTTRRSFVRIGIALASSVPLRSQKAARRAVTVTATGEEIPHPADAPLAMVRIPAGAFTMGERQAAHQVFLDEFSMAKYLVTNAEYKTFVDALGVAHLPRHWRGGTFPEDKANHPVLWVSWNDAQKYCAWVSRESGRIVTLPTEAQWEKAARGPQGFQYPWGNDPNQQCLNFNGVCARKYGLEVTADGQVPGWRDFTQTAEYRALVDGGGYTTPVGAFPQGERIWLLRYGRQRLAMVHRLVHARLCPSSRCRAQSARPQPRTGGRSEPSRRARQMQSDPRRLLVRAPRQRPQHLSRRNEGPGGRIPFSGVPCGHDRRMIRLMITIR